MNLNLRGRRPIGLMKHYKTSRLSQDKDEISRTRIGMNSFFNWLSQYTDSSIVETDIISYPTAKLKELKKEPRFIIERGKEIFYSLVTTFEPSLIISMEKRQWSMSTKYLSESD